MAQTIGSNDGIAATMNRLRDLDPKGTIMEKNAKGKWPADLSPIEPIPLDQWKAYDKLQRTLEILAWENDHAGGSPPDPSPPDPPAQTYKKVAPRVAYKAGNSDARYCLKDFPGLRDDVASYDSNGLCTDGRRSDGSPVDCVTSALEIDGREYCSLPTIGDPKLNTGSWTV